MLYDLAILCWVIGFASATVLAIGIATYQNYKKYVEHQPHNSRYDKESKEQSEEIDKWKRKVFRP